MYLRDLLNNLGYTENLLKLDTVTYSRSEDICSLVFVYSEKFKITNEDKKNIINNISPLFKDVCNFECKFICRIYDKDILKQKIKEFFEANYKALIAIVNDENVSFLKKDNIIKIDIRIDEISARIFDEHCFVSKLKEYLESKFFFYFDINIESVDNIKYEEIEEINTKQLNAAKLAYILSRENEINKLIINDVKVFIGKEIEQSPVFIKNIPVSDGESICCAGVISKLSKKTYLKKSKDEEQEPVEKLRVSFTVTDVTGKIDVVLFPNEKDVLRIDLLEDGQEILISGDTSNFNDRFNLRAKNISFCKVVTKDWQYLYQDEEDNYAVVNPQPIQEFSQMDLFSIVKDTEKNPYWDKHSVVMFDLETTGLDPETCQIIEIGAVKIVDGICVETFQTLVNPKEKISAEISNLTHITDEMVADAPTIDEVLPDFYKFTRDVVLSAYNIPFDGKFLEIAGKKLRYKFNNEQIDALDLVRKKVPSLHNYKLGTVVKTLGIELNNAHRALADAVAAAKVFIKLI